MTVERTGVLLSDNGELMVTALTASTAVPTAAASLKGASHFPIFGKFADATGAVYVRFV